MSCFVRIKTVLKALNEIGYILIFGDQERLKSLIEWVAFEEESLS